MKLAAYLLDGHESWGVVTTEGVCDFGLSRPSLHLPTIIDAIQVEEETISTALAADDSDRFDFDAVDLLPAVPAPGKVICIGLNFESHRIETGRDKTPYPVVFTRFSDSLVASGGALVAPTSSGAFDFEGELAVVVGRTARHVDTDNALAHVGALTCFNDGSVRDFQKHTHQFAPGKNFPNTSSLGPVLVTGDDMRAVDTWSITTRLNGDVVQSGSLDDLIYSISEVVSYCSTWTELNPGDVIAMGTPGGIGAARTPPLWMKPGDVCEVHIDGIGTLRNTVIAEAPLTA